MRRRVAVPGIITDISPRAECHVCDWVLGPLPREQALARLQSHVIAKGHSGALVTEHREIWEPRDA